MQLCKVVNKKSPMAEESGEGFAWQQAGKSLRAIHKRRLSRGGGRALCVEMGFTWTFPRNQDATVKSKSELISIKF